MLNFDEFRAVTKREKQAKQQSATINTSSKTEVKEEVTPRKSGSKNEKESYISSISNSIGDFLEMHQIQSLYLVLLITDSFACIAESQLRSPTADATIYGISNGIVLRAVQSFMGFTSIFFAAEIITVFSVFGLSIIGHWGYTADVLFITYQLYQDTLGNGKMARLLNIFKFWRLFRLFNSMVSIEKESHEQTIEKLGLKDVVIKKLELENNTLKEQVVKEKEARDSIEDMVQNYRDEVDTLNEALKIAAMDIAEVAQADDDMFDDEDDFDFDDELSRTLSAHSSVKAGTLMSGSQIDDASSLGDLDNIPELNKHKTAIMRAVMEDSKASNAARDRTAKSLQSTTFLVREDGTFEHK